MSRVRITGTWPSEPLTVPQVPTATNVEIRDDGQVSWSPGELRDIESELVLHEFLDLDLDGTRFDEVAEFFSVHGAPRPDLFSGSATMRYLRAEGLKVGRDGAPWEVAVEPMVTLQKCARHWLAMDKGEPTWSIWRGWEVEYSDELELKAAGRFVDSMNASLQRVHARIVLTTESESREDQFGDITAGVTDAMAVQLFNVIVEKEVPLKDCPNCGTTFQRQRGRAEKGQHRSVGVTYCSMKCARAKANRDYRRRKRQEKS